MQIARESTRSASGGVPEVRAQPAAVREHACASRRRRVASRRCEKKSVCECGVSVVFVGSRMRRGERSNLPEEESRGIVAFGLRCINKVTTRPRRGAARYKYTPPAFVVRALARHPANVCHNAKECEWHAIRVRRLIVIWHTPLRTPAGVCPCVRRAPCACE